MMIACIGICWCVIKRKPLNPRKRPIPLNRKTKQESVGGRWLKIAQCVTLWLHKCCNAADALGRKWAQLECRFNHRDWNSVACSSHICRFIVEANDADIISSLLNSSAIVAHIICVSVVSLLMRPREGKFLFHLVSVAIPRSNSMLVHSTSISDHLYQLSFPVFDFNFRFFLPLGHTPLGYIIIMIIIITNCAGGRHNMPRPCKLTFDLLTLKVVSESHVTWATSVPIFVFQA